MPAGQGIIRIKRGIVRPLTRFELQRGYFYLTRDRRLIEILDTDDFELDFCGRSVPGRHIDSYGRFQVPKNLIRSVPEGQILALSIVRRDLVRIEPAEA